MTSTQQPGTQQASPTREAREQRADVRSPNESPPPRADRTPSGAIAGAVFGTIVLAVGLLLGVGRLLEFGAEVTGADPVQEDAAGAPPWELLMPLMLVLVGLVIAGVSVVSARRARR